MQLTRLLDSVKPAFLVNPRLYFYLSPRPTSAVLVSVPLGQTSVPF